MSVVGFLIQIGPDLKSRMKEISLLGFVLEVTSLSLIGNMENLSKFCLGEGCYPVLLIPCIVNAFRSL